MLDLLIDIPLSVLLYTGVVFGFRFMHPLHDQEAPLAASPMVELSEDVIIMTEAFEPPLAPKEDFLIGGHVPSDDVLERHFLQYLAMVFEALYPAPQESVQRRHHVQWLGHEVLKVLASESDYEDLIDRYESLQHPAMAEDLVEELSMGTSAPLPVAHLKTIEEHKESQPLLHLPEDSVLRRHVIHRLVSEVESLFPRPTDSVLRRHYDQWLSAEWHECLHL
jgi:hypothetical protein